MQGQKFMIAYISELTILKILQMFLNRLVREHGSIDLEWLRDIPPDKAK